MIHNLQLRRHFKVEDNEAKAFVDLSFSQDGKHLLALSGAPDWSATLWSWEKTKVLCAGRVGSSADARIYEATICPWDTHVIAVVGDACLKLLRNSTADSPNHGEGVWQPQWDALRAKREIENQRSVCFLPHERVVIGTDHGQLLLYEQGVGTNPADTFVFKGVLIHSPEDGTPINKIVPFKKGFVCGGEGGMLHIFDRSEEKAEFFKKIRTFKVAQSSRHSWNEWMMEFKGYMGYTG